MYSLHRTSVSSVCVESTYTCTGIFLKGGADIVSLLSCMYMYSSCSCGVPGKMYKKLDKKLPNLATGPQQLACMLLSAAVKSLSKLHGYISRKNVYEVKQKFP